MEDSVNVDEAKTHFSRLLARVNQGEEIVMAKAGKPVARIVPYTLIASKGFGSKGSIASAKFLN